MWGFLVLLACVPLVCGIAGASQAPGSSVEDVVGLFEKLYYGSRSASECSGFLRQKLGERSKDGVVRDADLLYADAEMREIGCLDVYSTLRVVSTTPLLASGQAADSSVAQAEVHDSRLFIRIAAFTASHSAISRAVAGLHPGALESVRSVVVDLRGNPGGGLDDLRRVLDGYFAPNADVAFMHIHAAEWYGETKAFKSTMHGIFADMPTILLTDKATASAAEWLIATLRFEWYPHKTVVLGEKTYGKGIVQCTRPFNYATHASMKITCGEWSVRYPADVHMGPVKVQGRGIQPDRGITFPGCKRDYACIARELRALNL